MLDTGHNTPSYSGSLWGHHSSQVLSAPTAPRRLKSFPASLGKLDFPSDLYKPEVSWEVSQLHHPAFGVYSYSNYLVTFIPSWCSGG